jgi:Skp family chaperone for outer membrane proteins
MRRRVWTFCLCFAATVSGPVLAQDALDTSVAPQNTITAPDTERQRVVIQVPLIAFDRDRILQESDIGRALDAKIEVMRGDLVVENEEIFAALEAEEKELSILKGTLSSEAFALRADAFDAKVIAIRAEQKAKLETVQSTYDQGTRDFETALNVVLKDIAQEVGAVAVFERAQFYLMSGSIDISREAVARLNAQSVSDMTVDIPNSGTVSDQEDQQKQ